MNKDLQKAREGSCAYPRATPLISPDFAALRSLAITLSLILTGPLGFVRWNNSDTQWELPVNAPHRSRCSGLPTVGVKYKAQGAAEDGGPARQGDPGVLPTVRTTGEEKSEADTTCQLSLGGTLWPPSLSTSSPSRLPPASVCWGVRRAPLGGRCSTPAAHTVTGGGGWEEGGGLYPRLGHHLQGYY